jgi:hypothetical protein
MPDQARTLPTTTVKQSKSESGHFHQTFPTLSILGLRPQTVHHQHLRSPQLTIAMFLQRSAVAVARRAAVAPAVRRTFATTLLRRESGPSSAIGAPVMSSRLLPMTWRCQLQQLSSS